MGQFVTLYVTSSGRIADIQTGDWDDGAPELPASRESDLHNRQNAGLLLEKHLHIAPPHGWIFNRSTPERVVLVAAYALHKAKTTSGNAKAIALAALRDGYDVPDYRAKVLPGLLRRPTVPLKERIAEATAEFKADQIATKQMLEAFVSKLKGVSP